MIRLKPIERGVCRWIKKSEPDYGDEPGEVYYENKETKETVWDRPEEYWSEGEEEVDLDDESNAEYAQDLVDVATLVESRSKNGESLSDLDVEKVSDALTFLMRCKGISLGELFEHWVSALAREDPSGLLLLFDYLGTGESNVGDALNALKLSNKFIDDLAEGCWRAVSTKCEFVVAAKTLSRVYPLATVLEDWLICCYNYLSYVVDSSSDLDVDPKSLELVNLIELISSSFTVEEEEKYLLSCKCLITLLASFSTDVGVAVFEDLIAADYFSNDHKVAFKEAFLSLLNQSSTLSSEKLLQDQVLQCGKVLLASDVKQNKAIHDGVFNVQDANIVTDICILGISNLDPEDAARGDLLKLLSLTIATNSWQRDCHRYDDINECLLTIIDPKHDTFLASSVDLANKSLEVLRMLDDQE